MRRKVPQFLVRLPEDAKEFIAQQAARNGSSQNSEIIRCVRDRMEKMAATGSVIGVPNPAAAGHNNTSKECCDAAQR
jgi:hypothetical protein